MIVVIPVRGGPEVVMCLLNVVVVYRRGIHSRDWEKAIKRNEGELHEKRD